jgi:hypothetical protein
MSQRTTEAFEFELSNRQYEKITAMINKVYDKAEMDGIGESRHADKAAAVASGAKGFHEIMQHTKVHSYATEDKIKGQMHIFAEYCHTNYGTKQLNEIKPSMISSFLSEMADRGYSQKTFDSYCSTLERWAGAFDNALPQAGHCRSDEWHKVITECKGELRSGLVRLNTTSRAYDNPQVIIANIEDRACHLVASLQLNQGLRYSDACKLAEIYHDGGINHSKGGQAIKGLYSRLPVNQQNALKSLTSNEMHGLKYRYPKVLENAVKATGESYRGSATHGLRHNFAQSTYNHFIEDGMTKKEALLATSELMGHHRPDVTLQYLR